MKKIVKKNVLTNVGSERKIIKILNLFLLLKLAIFVIVIANRTKMEDLDEIEDLYSRQIELLDKEFIEKFKNSKKHDKLEESYKEKLSKLKEDYEKKVGAFLKIHKSYGLEKEEKPKEEEEEDETALDMSRPFKVRRVSIRRTSKDDINEKWELFKFRNHIGRRNFFHKFVPNFIVLLFIRIKFGIKKGFRFTISLISKMFTKFKDRLLEMIDSVKQVFKRISEFFKKIKAIVDKVKKKLSGKKGKDKESKEGSEEGEGNEDGSSEEKPEKEESSS